MHPSFRKTLSLLVCSLVLMGVIFGLIQPPLVRADVGVRPILPGGSGIEPGEETPVQMAAEVVTMTVREATKADNAIVELNPRWYGYDYQPVWYMAVADVEADFTMRNPTAEDISLTAWFPLASSLESISWELNPGEIVPRLKSFQVMVDGKTIPFETSELPNPKGTDKPPLPWASFPVTFPAGKDTLIHVSYTVPLSMAAKDPAVTVYYIFQTGAGWAGPIGQADLIVNLPYPASGETMTGMKSISLPYGGVGKTEVGIPAGAVLKGNQARWTWKNLEPGPEDDFAIWVIMPAKWKQVISDRAAVKARPNDGQAWLELAYTYHTLSTHWMSNSPNLFSSAYLPQAREAYQKAAALLPGHPAPHIGLGLLSLASYYGKIKSAPQSVISSVQQELKVAQQMETANPSLAAESKLSSWDLEDALSPFFYNDATATADRAAYDAILGTMTAQATIESATRTQLAVAKADILICWSTHGPDCYLTPSATASHTPEPSQTPEPVPTATLAVKATPFSDQASLLVIVAGVVILAAVGYLYAKRSGKGKK